MNIWIGKYYSDIYYSDKLFDIVITLYAPRYIVQKTTYSFINTNNIRLRVDDDAYISFINKVLVNLRLQDSANLYFYSDAIAIKLFAYNKSFIKMSHANNVQQFSWLNSKTYQRLLFQNEVNLFPFALKPGKDCLYSSLSQTFGTHYNKFVVQDNYSSGGHGTYFVTEGKEEDRLNDKYAYLVTPFFQGISCNVHILITKNDIIVFPWSRQKVKTNENDATYLGASFNKYDNILVDISNMSKSIGYKLQRLNYRGICGIDFLLVNNVPYFIEVNCRFQSSSIILDKVLNENYNTSLYCLHIDAHKDINFCFEKIKNILPFDCEYEIIRGNTELEELSLSKSKIFIEASTVRIIH